jgi:hypothetical protein
MRQALCVVIAVQDTLAVAGELDVRIPGTSVAVVASVAGTRCDDPAGNATLVDLGLLSAEWYGK